MTQNSGHERRTGRGSGWAVGEKQAARKGSRQSLLCFAAVRVKAAIIGNLETLAVDRQAFVATTKDSELQEVEEGQASARINPKCIQSLNFWAGEGSKEGGMENCCSLYACLRRCASGIQGQPPKRLVVADASSWPL
jgi:hypothetical protein